MSEIRYSIERTLQPSEFVEVLADSTLGERRPVDHPERIRQMCEHANLVVCARDDGRLVGVARALTDFSFCTYLSDLAVRKAYQRKGIGTRLLREVKQAAPQALLILLSAPAAVDYYPKIGMTKHEAAYVLRDVSELKSNA